MSVRVMDRVFWAKGLGKTKKAVLLAIGDAANDGGFGYLLISTLSMKTDLGERAIQAAIAELCEGDEPILEKRERQNRSSIFRIHVDRIPLHDRKASIREQTLEEMWGASPAPLQKGGVNPLHPGGASHDNLASSDSPITVSSPSDEPDSPLSLTGEAPPRDLLGDLDGQSTALVAAKPSIIEYVAQGWQSLTERYTRIPSVRAWNDSRKKAIARRADEVVRAAAGAVDAYQVWDQIFAAIAGDQWLRGEADPGKGYDRAYVVEIDHVLRTGGTPNFLWILERATTNDRDNRVTNDPATGRRMGPAEQATHAALARLRASRERSGGGGDRAGNHGSGARGS